MVPKGNSNGDCRLWAASCVQKVCVCALSLRQSLRCRCAVAALSLRCRCAVAALSLRCRCAVAALSLRCRRAVAALSLCCSDVAALSLRCRRAVAALSLCCSDVFSLRFFFDLGVIEHRAPSLVFIQSSASPWCGLRAADDAALLVELYSVREVLCAQAGRVLSPRYEVKPDDSLLRRRTVANRRGRPATVSRWSNEHGELCLFRAIRRTKVGAEDPFVEF